MKSQLSQLLIGGLLLKAALACCSLGPAHFSKTRGLAAEVRVKGKLVHLLGYQNTALNRSKAGGNALLLPIPARRDSMGPANILDTSTCPNAFQDMETAVHKASTTRTLEISREGNGVQVFDHDIYTIVLARDAKAIPGALNQVKEERRPSLAPEIFAAYGDWYPGWTFALCCFNTKAEAQGSPMIWWYEPLHPESLFFPALDAHNGKPPDLKAEVEVDHMLMVSSWQMTTPRNRPVEYTDRSIAPAVRAYLPHKVIGRQMEGMMPNGDFVFDLKKVQRGDFSPQRSLPPGADPVKAKL